MDQFKGVDQCGSQAATVGKTMRGIVGEIVFEIVMGEIVIVTVANIVAAIKHATSPNGRRDDLLIVINTVAARLNVAGSSS